jgi:DNA polymerase-3 subunit delta
MIYFFYGQDTYRLQARVKELYAGLLIGSPNLERKTLSATDLLFTDFIEELSAMSMFTNQKLIIIENLIKEGDEELHAKIVKWLDSPLPDGVVVVFKESDIPDRRLAIFKALNKLLVEQYPPLTSFQTRNWLMGRALELKLKLSPNAASHLLKDFNGDLWRLSSELNKLSAYADGAEVTEKMVCDLAPGLFTDRIFEVIDALAQKKLALANKLINQQISFGTNEQRLIAMFAYQFRNLALVTDLMHQGISQDKLLSTSGLHPYVLQKTLGMTRGFTTSNLSKIFQWLRRIDMATKQGKISPEVGIDILTAQIAYL